MAHLRVLVCHVNDVRITCLVILTPFPALAAGVMFSVLCPCLCLHLFIQTSKLLGFHMGKLKFTGDPTSLPRDNMYASTSQEQGHGRCFNVGTFSLFLSLQ